MYIVHYLYSQASRIYLYLIHAIPWRLNDVKYSLAITEISVTPVAQTTVKESSNHTRTPATHFWSPRQSGFRNRNCGLRRRGRGLSQRSVVINGAFSIYQRLSSVCLCSPDTLIVLPLSSTEPVRIRSYLIAITSGSGCCLTGCAVP